MTILLSHGRVGKFPDGPRRPCGWLSILVLVSFPIPFHSVNAAIKLLSLTPRYHPVIPTPRILISLDLPSVSCLVTHCVIPLWSSTSYHMWIRLGVCDIKANELGDKII